MSADTHDRTRDDLVDTLFTAEGETSSELRRAAAAGEGLPDDLAPLIDKIHKYAYKVIDEDIEAAKELHSEDALFEIICSAAVGASLHRLEAGLAALDAAIADGDAR